MFGLFHKKINNQEIYNDNILIVSNGPSTQYLNALINGTYIKNSYGYGYDYSNIDYHNMPIQYSKGRNY